MVAVKDGGYCLTKAYKAHNEIGLTRPERVIKMFSFKKKSQRYPSVKTTEQFVKTKRWVHRNQLKVGMYVSELDKPWEETRFMFQGFVIDSRALLEEVQNTSEYVQVDAEKWAAVSSNSTNRLCAVTQ